MKIKKIKKSKELAPTYDIEVADVHNYLLLCGESCLVSHNSSYIQGTTNGMEPPRSLISHKSGKPILVPSLRKWKNKYEFAYDAPNNLGLIKCVSAVVKLLDMAASGNLYYPSGEIEEKQIVSDVLTATHYGWKTFYYNNVDDGDSSKGDFKEEVVSCEGGACSI